MYFLYSGISELDELRFSARPAPCFASSSGVSLLLTSVDAVDIEFEMSVSEAWCSGLPLRVAGAGSIESFGAGWTLNRPEASRR